MRASIASAEARGQARSAPPCPTRLSQSPIWRLQRRYFEDAGIEAWRHNTVPSYVTTNPFIAGAYVELALSFAEDCRRAGHAPTTERPLTILELGAGSGRFALNFLTQLIEEREHGGLPGACPPVRYVMTDISAANIAFWRAHPRFAPHVAAGRLDFSMFGAATPGPLRLQEMGRNLAPADIGPLVVVANYVFDTIEQDLFRVEHGRLEACFATIRPEAPHDASEDGAPDAQISNLALDYHPSPCPPAFYDDPSWNAVLAGYRRKLGRGAFLLPVGALACLVRMRALTQAPMLTLACDRGQTRHEELEGEAPPQPLPHGSFSLPVNFHALIDWSRRQGGVALAPAHAHASIAVVALAFGLGPGAARDLRRRYAATVDRFGPDDFFMIKRAFDGGCEGFVMAQILALLRLSRWDAVLLVKCYQALIAALPQATPGEKRGLTAGLQQMWRQHLDLGEADDLAFRLGSLLAGIGEAEAAIPLLEHSIARDGADPAALDNLAWCRAAVASRRAPG